MKKDKQCSLRHQLTFTPKLIDTNNYGMGPRIDFKFRFDRAVSDPTCVKLFFNAQMHMTDAEMTLYGEDFDSADVNYDIDFAFTMPFKSLLNTIDNPIDIEELDGLYTEVLDSAIGKVTFYNNDADKELTYRLASEHLQTTKTVFNEKELLAGCTLECVLESSAYWIKGEAG